MSIVSRIKTFMAEFEIQSSQFADACNIPRPTISQILSGRNKKISDEIINKIHKAYPALSISWLLFGEGNMSNDLTESINSSNHHQNTNFFDDNKPKLQTSNIANLFSDKNISNDKDSNTSVENDIFPNNSQSTFINFSNNQTSKNKKRITNILVFYEDNSFDSFIPSSNNMQ